MADIRTDTSLEITRLIPAPREEVFRAWTEPDRLLAWACPEGATFEGVDVDLRVGGRYRFRMVGAEGERHTAHGVYREIVPPEKLVYTWDWEEAAARMGETLVTVRFQDLGESTEVVLVHERFPAPEATEGHAQGWASCLDRLERLLKEERG